MDTVKFWHLIEKAKQKSGSQGEEQSQILQDSLSRLSAKEIAAFDKIFREMYALTWRWDLWGAAYLINRGCSYDSFGDFRGWLIAQGKIVFQQALDDPESLEDMIKANDLNKAACEDLLYAAATAYEEKMERALHLYKSPEPKMMGQPWEKDDLAVLLPKLSAKCALLQQETSGQE